MKKIDKFHIHEVIDRCNFICDIIEEGIMNHPALSLTMQKKLQEAQKLICEVGCIACGPQCKKCGITAMTDSIVKGRKCAVCLNCFHKQKREKHEKSIV